MGETTTIGIHICGGTLRRAELVQRDQRIEVARLDSLPPLAGSAAGGASPPVAAKPSINGSRLAAALPATDVMSRCWPLPSAAGARMKQLVANRLEADLPVPLNTLTWGYRQARAAGEERAGQLPVLAQAARSERIQQHLAHLAGLGLPVHLLTTEAEGLAGLYRHGLSSPNATGDDVLILAGAGEWLVCSFAGGLARSVQRIRLASGGFETACRECRQLIATQFQPGALGSIRWCGSPAVDEAADVLARICGVPVERVRLTDRITRPGSEPLGAQDIVDFGPAIGLALAEMFDRDSVIRLAGAESAEEAGPQRRLEKLLARPLACAGAAAAMLVLAAGIHIGALKWETHRMNTAPGGTAATAALDRLQPEIRAVNRLKQYRINVEAICADVARAIKDPITLTALQLSRERRLVIKGNSKEPNAVFTLADDLRKSTRFRNVNPERAAPGQGGDFTITAELTDVEKFSQPAWGGAR